MLVLYDRDCGFCRFSMGLLLAWDRRRRLRPVEIQSHEGERLLAGLTPADRLATAHAIGEDGQPRSGGSAAAPVLRRLPGGAPLARLAERLPSTAEWVYHAVAARRSGLGRLLPDRAKSWADRVLVERADG
jgi:predicted DCC family thiol-disulfide oxidoreductase YuxK